MSCALAIDGGMPVRQTLLPYSKPMLTDADRAAVMETLESDWLTTGPKVDAFEKALATFVGTEHAVAVSNGTAALHTAVHALGIGKGDEVIVPAMTFAASANCVLYEGGTPVFVDSDPETLLIDPACVEKALTKKTKAIVAVDYGGQPCDYAALRAIATRWGIKIIADACHALGGDDHGKQVGSLADLNTFSFHAVKPLATGEGGMITTDNEALAKRMRRFRNHGITSDHRERHEADAWFYEMTDLGFNYRLTDIQCALGISQLKSVPANTTRRRAIAAMYDKAFENNPAVKPLGVRKGVTHAYHLYVVLLQTAHLSIGREEIFRALRRENIGVNVHYIPVHLHPYYRKHLGTKPGTMPMAESAYERMLSIPLFAGMSDQDAEDVITAVEKVCDHYKA